MILFLWASLYADAQTIIYPAFEPSDDFTTNGAYYKDLNGDLDKLVGTWQYVNGDELFKIQFEKKLLDKLTDEEITYWEDSLFGEYQYINSLGTEVNNSLGEMQNLYPDVSQHLIYGFFIISPSVSPYCEECLPAKRRVKLSIKDPGRSTIFYDMIVLPIPASSENNNTPQLKVTIKYYWSMVPEGEPNDDRLPTNIELILSKVN